MATVLVLDNDPLQLELAGVLLRRDGHEALLAPEPETALDLLAEERVDVVVIETALPKHDGYRLGQQIRQLKPALPLLVVSERGDDEFVVRALLAFADDYVVKPYSPRQLLARIHSLLRRTGASSLNRMPDGSIVVGELALNLHQMQVTVGQARIGLTPRELSLLSALMMNPDRVLSRSQLTRLAWGDDFEGCLKTVDVCVQRLRKKIQPGLGGKDYIEAVRGFGYKLQRPAPAKARPSIVPSLAASAS
jgi:DNA-binding response OmpR family regulator